jgi:hypothetical protein
VIADGTAGGSHQHCLTPQEPLFGDVWERVAMRVDSVSAKRKRDPLKLQPSSRRERLKGSDAGIHHFWANEIAGKQGDLVAAAHDLAPPM